MVWEGRNNTNTTLIDETLRKRNMVLFIQKKA